MWHGRQPVLAIHSFISTYWAPAGHGSSGAGEGGEATHGWEGGCGHIVEGLECHAEKYGLVHFTFA